jgi:pimeloyl-ACP methyl ester carboxylesterase
MSGVATSRDGIPLAFEVHGAGTPTLVFVHGWSCDRSYWRGQVRPLAARYQTVAVDLAGHGESGVGRRAWTMAPSATTSWPWPSSWAWASWC